MATIEITFLPPIITCKNLLLMIYCYENIVDIIFFLKKKWGWGRLRFSSIWYG